MRDQRQDDERRPGFEEILESPLGAAEQIALRLGRRIARTGSERDAEVPAIDQRLRTEIETVKRQAPHQEREFGGHALIARPPVTDTTVPVEYDASSDSSQRMARATSSGVPGRPCGTC